MKSNARPVAVPVGEVLAWLEAKGTRRAIDDLKRYGISAPKAFGVSVGDLKKYAKQIGPSQVLAQGLWKSGWYEARLLASFVGEPGKVTLAQMEQWADDFDNWGVVDTVCFSLFDRTAHAWKVIPRWAKAEPEFKKRAAFALLWSLSVHDKTAGDEAFVKSLAIISSGASDGRHFVKKAVDMALRAIGKRNGTLHAAAIETAQHLARSAEPSARWIGRHALRELESAKVAKRLGRSRRS